MFGYDIYIGCIVVCIGFNSIQPVDAMLCSINGLLNGCVIIMSISLSFYTCIHAVQWASVWERREREKKKNWTQMHIAEEIAEPKEPIGLYGAYTAAAHRLTSWCDQIKIVMNTQYE